jgi:hypothetical protein
MNTTFKQLRFPVAGVAENLSFRDATIPDESRTFSSPHALNVLGEDGCTRRLRGGSRPGLRRFEGTVSVVNGGKWLWPNGEAIAWPDGNVLSYTTVTKELVAPDGSLIIDPHEAVSAHCVKGAIPPAPTLAAMYRNRLFLASGSDWFCSRIAEHGDFDYGGDGEDPSRALAGNCALAGRKGETITAFMPVNDRFMLVATRRNLWVFGGDPSEGVSLLHDSVGCISANAWCNTPMGVVFVANGGVYLYVQGEAPSLLSGKLPMAMSGIDEALLAYDPEMNGVFIFSEKHGTAHDWFMSFKEMAFWPVSLPSNMRPVAVCRVLDGGIEKSLLHGKDGEWRMFHREQETDDGVALKSHVVIGPFRVSARDDLDGILAEVHATFGGCGNVWIDVFCAKSAEEAVNRASFGGEDGRRFAQSGRNRVFRPRTRGAWACLKISSNTHWAYEGVTVALKHLGRLR